MIKRILVTAFCLLMATHLGCAAVRPKAKAEAEKKGDPEWLEDLKAVGGIGGQFGMSKESREIEKSLAGQ
ncbi:MAG: hypothetical protein ABI614_18905 [Planctomycetota bacterium]